MSFTSLLQRLTGHPRRHQTGRPRRRHPDAPVATAQVVDHVLAPDVGSSP
jgi:hypothetical protein